MACVVSGPQSNANLKCLPTICGDKTTPSQTPVVPPRGTERYTSQLAQRWIEHRKYLLTVEEAMDAVFSKKQNSHTFAPCNVARRQLVMAYCILHGGFAATVEPANLPASEMYWEITIRPAPTLRSPKPKLSAVLENPQFLLPFTPVLPSMRFKQFPPKLEACVEQWIYHILPKDEPFYLSLETTTASSGSHSFVVQFRTATQASQGFQKITGQAVRFEDVSPIRSSRDAWVEKLKVTLFNIPFLNLRGKTSTLVKKAAENKE